MVPGLVVDVEELVLSQGLQLPGQHRSLPVQEPQQDQKNHRLEPSQLIFPFSERMLRPGEDKGLAPEVTEQRSCSQAWDQVLWSPMPLHSPNLAKAGGSDLQPPRGRDIQQGKNPSDG